MWLIYYNIYDNDISHILTNIETIINKYNLTKTNAEGYLKLRSDYNNSINKDSIMFYMLNCYSFNYQIRFNSKGEFNMPFGKHKSSFNDNMRNNLILFKDKLNCNFYTFNNFNFTDYSDTNFNSDDFIYLDPPYLNTSTTYNEHCLFPPWTIKEEELLRNMLDIINTKWALSNNLTSNPTLKDWAEQNNYEIHYIQHSYSNCNYQRKTEQLDKEVLITNYHLEPIRIGANKLLF